MRRGAKYRTTGQKALAAVRRGDVSKLSPVSRKMVLELMRPGVNHSLIRRVNTGKMCLSDAYHISYCPPQIQVAALRYKGTSRGGRLFVKVPAKYEPNICDKCLKTHAYYRHDQTLKLYCLECWQNNIEVRFPDFNRLKKLDVGLWPLWKRV